MAPRASRPRTPAPRPRAPWRSAVSRTDDHAAGCVGGGGGGRGPDRCAHAHLDERCEALGQSQIARPLGREWSASAREHGDLPAVAELARLAQQEAHPQFPPPRVEDRKSTRLNSSHLVISYAVFCLKKKKKITSVYAPLT